MLNVEKEVAAMERMTVDQLRGKYAQEFGEPTNGRHKEWLIKRIAWRMQANAEGDLSERARRQAAELANDADLRTMAPRLRKASPDAEMRTLVVPTKLRANTELLPGTVIKRDYKDRTIRVTALVEGFEFEGERYRSLTAVTKAVTGKHWNGFHFFGLRKIGGRK